MVLSKAAAIKCDAFQDADVDGVSSRCTLEIGQKQCSSGVSCGGSGENHCLLMFLWCSSLLPGGHSWWLHPTEELPCTHQMDSLTGAATAPATAPAAEAGARASVVQLSMALGGLRSVFSPLLFRGLFSFFAWWIAACLFSTSLFGLFYHQYLMAA